MPGTEWSNVERVLSTAMLARLVGVSSSSVRRYAAGTRSTPDEVAARLQLLALVVEDLAGSYNDAAIRRWFWRPRMQLAGQSPAELLAGAWGPRDEGPARVQQLAAALRGAPAT